MYAVVSIGLLTASTRKYTVTFPNYGFCLLPSL